MSKIGKLQKKAETEYSENLEIIDLLRTCMGKKTLSQAMGQSANKTEEPKEEEDEFGGMDIMTVPPGFYNSIHLSGLLGRIFEELGFGVIKRCFHRFPASRQKHLIFRGKICGLL